MLTDASRAELPEWNARKLAQWDRIKGRMPGLQLVRSGEGKSQFNVNISTDDGFYEGLVIGQLEQIERVAVPHRRNVWRDRPSHEKGPANRRIDLTDSELDAVLVHWVQGRSVAGDKYLVVWFANGKSNQEK